MLHWDNSRVQALMSAAWMTSWKCDVKVEVMHIRSAELSMQSISTGMICPCVLLAQATKSAITGSQWFGLLGRHPPNSSVQRYSCPWTLLKSGILVTKLDTFEFLIYYIPTKVQYRVFVVYSIAPFSFPTKYPRKLKVTVEYTTPCTVLWWTGNFQLQWYKNLLKVAPKGS